MAFHGQHIDEWDSPETIFANYDRQTNTELASFYLHQIDCDRLLDVEAFKVIKSIEHYLRL
ncbi:MAG: hypothetical protein DCF20_07790 [Pseudanabaena sp.]|nr:MAG: hypothetical protein DCF20_07790 [Pseudanabaena sp.]